MVSIERAKPGIFTEVRPGGAAINFFRWASERIHRKFHLVVGAVKNTRRNLPIRISSWLVSTAESTG